MIRLLFILPLIALFGSNANAQAITIDNLLTLTSLPQNRVGNFMSKKGYLSSINNQSDIGGIRFYQKPPRRKKDPISPISRNVDMYKKATASYFALHTTSRSEFIDAKSWLKDAGFYFDTSRDSTGQAATIYQKKIFTVWADSTIQDTTITYNILLERKELPDPTTIHFAEDLLAFNSNEQLATYFGIENVKRDVYYFSEREMKKCSILFPNTNRQAIFVWEDEPNLRKLSYILISGIAPTIDAVMYSQNVGQNRWTTRQGLNAGMSLRELVRRNGDDFKFFGPNNEFAYMVEPKHEGYIDFKKTGIMLGCLDCSSTSSIELDKIEATDAIEKGMTLYIFYIMVSP